MTALALALPLPSDAHRSRSPGGAFGRRAAGAGDDASTRRLMIAASWDGRGERALRHAELGPLALAAREIAAQDLVSSSMRCIRLAGLRMVQSSGDAERDALRAKERERDRLLVERAKAGEKKALGELLRLYGPLLFRSVLLPRLGSEAAAHDALAETYEKVVAKLDAFEWQNVGFFPWLRVVALRVALDHLRARKRLVVWEADDVQREVDASATTTPLDERVSDVRDRDAVKKKLHAALAALNPRYAEAIRLRVLEEVPREEVATRMGVTPATFDVLLHRATAALKKALVDRPEGESATIAPGKTGSPPKENRHG